MTTVQTATNVSKTNLLRHALQGNGIFSGVSGLAFILAAKPIAAFLGLDAPLVLAGLGVGLVLYAAGLFREGAREPLNRQFAVVAILLDLAWVVGSAVLLLTNWLPFTTAGSWAVAIVADVVAVFAILQFIGLRRLRPGLKDKD